MRATPRTYGCGLWRWWRGQEAGPRLPSLRRRSAVWCCRMAICQAGPCRMTETLPTPSGGQDSLLRAPRTAEMSGWSRRQELQCQDRHTWRLHGAGPRLPRGKGSLGRRPREARPLPRRPSGHAEAWPCLLWQASKPYRAGASDYAPVRVSNQDKPSLPTLWRCCCVLPTRMSLVV